MKRGKVKTHPEMKKEFTAQVVGHGWDAKPQVLEGRR